MTNERAAESGDTDIAYTYRPSIMGAPWEFKLTPHGIHWVVGSRSGHIPYRSVRRLRMSYKPMSMQTHRFVTEIWADDAPKLQIVSTSWKSMVELERQDKTYAAFITELHRRVASVGTPVQCLQGRSQVAYWPGLVVFIGVALALAATTARAVESGIFGAAVVIAAFLALFLWQGGNFFRRNRPGVYRVDEPPAELMPKT